MVHEKLSKVRLSYSISLFKSMLSQASCKEHERRNRQRTVVTRDQLTRTNLRTLSWGTDSGEAAVIEPEP